MLHLTLLLAFLLTVSSLIEIQEENKEETELITYAQKIYQEECKFCRTTLIIHTDDEMSNKFLKIISKEHKPSSFITVPLSNYTLQEEYIGIKEKPDLVLLFLNVNSNNISVVVFGIEILSIWNIRAKHLFLVTEIDDDYHYWLKESFEALWERQVLRSIICFHLKGQLKIFTYNPFLEQYGIDISHKMNETPIFLGNIQNMNGYSLKGYYLDTVFKNTLIKEVNDGKINYRGNDGKFIGTVVEALNASFAIRKLSEDFDDSMVSSADVKVNFMDAVELMRSQYDFDFICSRLGTFPDNELSHIFLLEHDSMKILLPTAAMVPQYLYILQIIPFHIWIGTCILFLLISFLIAIAKKMYGSGYKKIDILADNLRLLVNASIPIRTRGGQEKVLLCLWMFFCLIFDTMFNSYLTSVLVKPKYYKNIEYFDELYQTDIKVLTPSYHASVLESVFNDTRLKKHILPVSKNVTKYGVGNWFLGYMDQGVAISSTQIEFLKNMERKYKTSTRKSYHVMKEILLPIVMSYGVVPDKIYYREFLNIITRIQESGLHLYWRTYNYDQDDDYNHTQVTPESENKVIALVHLQSGFMLLILGQIAAFVIFIIEIFTCIPKRKQPINKKKNISISARRDTLRFQYLN